MTKSGYSAAYLAAPHWPCRICRAVISRQANLTGANSTVHLSLAKLPFFNISLASIDLITRVYQHAHILVCSMAENADRPTAITASCLCSAIAFEISFPESGPWPPEVSLFCSSMLLRS